MHFVWMYVRMYGPFSTHALFLMVLVKVSSMPANCAFLSMPFFSFYIIFSSLDMSVSLRHFLQMNILIIQKQRNIKKRMVLQALAVSTRLDSAELRNQWSTHQEWWASISENKPLHKERERESSARGRKKTMKNNNNDDDNKARRILKWNALKMRKQISFTLNIFHPLLLAGITVVVCKLFLHLLALLTRSVYFFLSNP